VNCPHCEQEIELRLRRFSIVRVVSTVVVVVITGGAILAWTYVSDEIVAEKPKPKTFTAVDFVPDTNQPASDYQPVTYVAPPANNPVEDQPRRANDIAERKLQDEESQARAEADASNAKFHQMLDQMDTDEKLDEINSKLEEMQLDSLRQAAVPTVLPTSPQNEQWILRYNPFSHSYSYEPPNAILQYNAFENRYEWVPQ
jgi:hypothetical protein